MLDIVEVMNSGPVEIALKMWQGRFALGIGQVSSVWTTYTVEVHRLSDAEFLLYLGDISRKEKSAILDAIREDSASNSPN